MDGLIHQGEDIDERLSGEYFHFMKELPIACSLSPAEGEQRLERWHRVGADARLGTQLRGRTLAVTFRESAWQELTELVGAERTCCAFLDWSIAPSDGAIVLTISSDASGEPELRRLAELFGASG